MVIARRILIVLILFKIHQSEKIILDAFSLRFPTENKDYDTFIPYLFVLGYTQEDTTRSNMKIVTIELTKNSDINEKILSMDLGSNIQFVIEFIKDENNKLQEDYNFQLETNSNRAGGKIPKSADLKLFGDGNLIPQFKEEAGGEEALVMGKFFAQDLGNGQHKSFQLNYWPIDQYNLIDNENITVETNCTDENINESGKCILQSIKISGTYYSERILI